MELYAVRSVEPLPNYRLRIVFRDGTEGEISLADKLWGPVFEPLRDDDLFRQVTVDEYGVVCWPNGADLAPDALYHRIHGTTPVGR